MAHGTDGRGCLFLDRSPDLFAVLLQFLRTRSRPPESVLANKFALLCECDFFGCEAFAQVLRGESSPFDLRPDDRALRLREQFARRDACTYNLVDLFNTSTAVRPREELQIPILELSSIARPHLAVGSFQEFYKRLDSWSGHLIDDLGSIPGLVIAGGSVLSALTRTSAGDLDIFLTVSKAEAEATLRQIFSAVQRNHARNGGGKLLGLQRACRQDCQARIAGWDGVANEGIAKQPSQLRVAVWHLVAGTICQSRDALRQCCERAVRRR